MFWFWIGLLVALAAGLLQTGYARAKLKTAFPRLNETLLDVLLAALLIAGLVTSARDRLQSEQGLASIRDSIVSATTTVDLVLNWQLPRGDARSTLTSWSASLTGGVGYVAFGRRGSPLLVIRSQRIVMRSISARQVSLVALCDLNAPESVVRSSLHDLARADLLQLGLPDTVPDVTKVESGSVKVTLNGSREATVPVGGSVVHGAKIVVELKGLSLSSSLLHDAVH